MRFFFWIEGDLEEGEVGNMDIGVDGWYCICYLWGEVLLFVGDGWSFDGWIGLIGWRRVVVREVGRFGFWYWGFGVVFELWEVWFVGWVEFVGMSWWYGSGSVLDFFWKDEYCFVFGNGWIGC